MSNEIDLNDGLAALLRLKYACEIGDGIDQHCAPDIEIAIDEVKRLRAIIFEHTAPLDWREAYAPE